MENNIKRPLAAFEVPKGLAGKLSPQGRCVRAEINVLSYTLRRDGTLAVLYEFPYRARGVDRRWSKQVEVMPDTLSADELYGRLYQRVQGLRAELEQ